MSNKVGKIALWKSDQTKAGPNSPVLVGELELDGKEMVRVKLWRNNSEHPRAPFFTGSVETVVRDPERRG